MIACTATIDLDSSTATMSSREQPIAFESLQQLKQLMTDSSDFIQGDLADFRRAADNVRLAQLATILCASNLGDKWSSEGTALIGINGDGCALNNRLFWDDFIFHGHDNGRASLFVPTLPFGNSSYLFRQRQTELTQQPSFSAISRSLSPARYRSRAHSQGKLDLSVSGFGSLFRIFRRQCCTAP
jgi:hypothetical protein